MVGEDGDTPGGQEGVAGPCVLLKNLLTDARVIKADSENFSSVQFNVIALLALIFDF